MELNRKFICTQGESQNTNHNKYWNIKVIQSTVMIEYGRVGIKPNKTERAFSDPEKAIKFANSKIKSKTLRRNGKDSEYIELDMVEASTVKTDEFEYFKSIASGPQALNLLKYLHGKNIHNITSNTNITYNTATGVFETPLGIVSRNSVISARSILSDIEVSLNPRNKSDNRLAEKFMQIIPMDIGRHAPSLRRLCPDKAAYSKLVGILDNLESSLDIISKTKATACADMFEVKLSKVKSPALFNKLDKMYKSSASSMHSCSSMKLHRVWKVEHKDMNHAYNKVGAKMSNIKTLFHGSSASNVLSILANGFKIVSSSASHVAGRAFGDGVYFSQTSTKALGYSTGLWGGSSYSTAFMFVCDVAMGKEYRPTSITSKKCPSGYDSTHAVKGSPFINDEEIVYNTNQIKPKYLCEFKKN